MNYLTNYYKNLCEQLQNQVNLLEAGLNKALKTGKAELMKKELIKQRERLKSLDKNDPRAKDIRSNIEALAFPLQYEHGMDTGVGPDEVPESSPYQPRQGFKGYYPSPEETVRMRSLKIGLGSSARKLKDLKSI